MAKKKKVEELKMDEAFPGLEEISISDLPLWGEEFTSPTNSPAVLGHPESKCRTWETEKMKVEVSSSCSLFDFVVFETLLQIAKEYEYPDKICVSFREFSRKCIIDNYLLTKETITKSFYSLTDIFFSCRRKEEDKRKHWSTQTRLVSGSICGNEYRQIIIDAIEISPIALYLFDKNFNKKRNQEVQITIDFFV